MRIISSLVCILVTIALSGCLSFSPPAIRALDDGIVYQPTRYPDGQWSPPDLVFEDAYFEAADGTKLHGWFCPCSQPRAVVLFAHGNAGNLSYHWERMQLMQRDLHVAALIFDYRGYGRSGGLPNEKGVLADARAARKWLADRCGIGEQEIVLVGQSLGGGVAVDLAAKDGAAGLILESTFTSMPDVASHHLPYSPARYLMRNRFNSLAKIGNYHGPLLLAHGDADKLISVEQGQKLFAAAGGPKSLAIIPGADHNWAYTREYVQRLDQFFAEQAASRPVRVAETNQTHEVARH